MDDADLDLIADASPDVENEVEEKFADERAAALCRRLREPYRSVALDYFCRDLTLAEISARTGDNPKTVATRLYRAKNLLKLLINEEAAAT